MTSYGSSALILLALFGFAGGVGITAVGPGGILPTIGLVALVSATPAQIAGTAIVTHVATGGLGTLAYLRSGELRRTSTRRVAAILMAAALVGTPLGIVVNSAIPARWFTVGVGGVAIAVAALVLLRRGPGEDQAARVLPTVLIAAIGLGVAVAAGIIGIGGPMLTVPMLVAAGLVPLEALAAAQAQSVIISATGAAGYLLQGQVDWTLAATVGIPELAGVLIGWRVARALPTRTLRIALVVTLAASGGYLLAQV